MSDNAKQRIKDEANEILTRIVGGSIYGEVVADDYAAQIVAAYYLGERDTRDVLKGNLWYNRKGQ